MKIAILCDVHDNLRVLSRVIDYLNDQKIDLMINCGDWDMPFTMRTYVKAKFPIKGVMGNGDPDIQKFLYQLQNHEILKGLQLDLHFRFWDLVVDGKRIGAIHGDDEQLNNALIESQLYDYFYLGHDHVPKVKKVGRTTVVNPGSLIGYLAEKGVVPITFALQDTTTDEVKIVDFEKETGLNFWPEK